MYSGKLVTSEKVMDYIRGKITPRVKIWEDYLALLQWFNKDLSSFSLVCPENLNEAHDKLVAKKRELQRKKYLMKMRAEILQAQEVYEN